MAQTLAILFADICESSKLYQSLGAERASAMIKDHLSHLSETVSSLGGRVVDEIGDEIMTSFPDANLALQAAVEIQWATWHAASASDTDARLAMRIGIHEGEVVFAGEKPSGPTVYRAKRLTDLAGAHQVFLERSILTEEAVTSWPLRDIESTVLKGQDQRCELVELIWNELEATEVLVRPVAGRTSVTRLVLRGSTGEYALGPHQKLSVGRLPPADIVVPSTQISRTHATLIGGKSYGRLADSSTNGTFVVQGQDLSPRRVHRDELWLRGTGWIGFGSPPSPESIHTLFFEYRQSVTEVES